MVVSSGLLDKMDVAWDDCREEFKHVFGGEIFWNVCARPTSRMKCSYLWFSRRRHCDLVRR